MFKCILFVCLFVIVQTHKLCLLDILVTFILLDFPCALNDGPAMVSVRQGLLIMRFHLCSHYMKSNQLIYPFGQVYIGITSTASSIFLHRFGLANPIIKDKTEL